MPKDKAISKWMSFDEAENHPGSKLCGVYVLGLFTDKVKVPSKVNPTAKEVVYVGESCDQSIGARLYQFGRSAFQKKNGHSAGWTFNDEFLGGKTIKSAPQWLHVAILPIEREEPSKSAWIRYMERKLIWEFVERRGEMPRCNHK